MNRSWQRPLHIREESAIDIERRSASLQCMTAVSSTCGPYTDGGDFAESFPIRNGAMAIGIWDASGHGRPAAPAMRLVRAGLRALLSVNADIAATAVALNRVLVRQATGESFPPFVKGFFGLLDPPSGQFTYVSCGHEAAMLFNAARGHQHLFHNCPVLGLNETSRFAADVVHLKPGDTLVVATDGITDAHRHRSTNEFFGTGGICSLFASRSARSGFDAAEIVSRAAAFSDGCLHDDAAVLIARYG